MFRIFVAGFLLCLVSSSFAAEILSVFPTGAVKQVQQVLVKFSSDMVSLGDPRSKNDPLTLHCQAGAKRKFKEPKFSTRWADSKTWSLDFSEPLKAGVNCTLTLAEIKDLKGQAVTGYESYSFSTGGPAILGISPQYGDIEPDQYFIVETDGAIDAQSVQKLAYFETESLADKTAVELVSDEKIRESLIRADVEHSWRWNQYRKLLAGKKDFSKIAEFKNFIILRGVRRFAEDHRVQLHWPVGILSQSGVAVQEAQKYDFKVLPPFEVKFLCERTAPTRPCNPILDMRLRFSNRVKIEKLKDVKLVSESGQVYFPLEIQSGDQNKNSAAHASSGKRTHSHFRVVRNFADEEVNVLTFQAPFPERTKFKIQMGKNIQDELERPLVNENKFPLEVATDEYSPLIKFSGAFGLLESGADPILPVSLRNVEKEIPSSQISVDGKTMSLSAADSPKEVIRWYHAVNKKYDNYDERSRPLLGANEGQKIKIPKPLGEREFELMGIPLKKPGLHIVELESPKLGQFLLGSGTMYVASAALVTNLSVHFKKGRESSLVWVTALDTGRPVKAAEVAIYSGGGQKLAQGKTDSDGVLKLTGVHYPCGFKLSGKSDGDEDNWQDSQTRDCEVFAFAKRDDDFSFVSDRWSHGIEEYRFNLRREYLAPQWGPVVIHSILSRSLLQAGESIQMKHILREHSSEGFRKINPKVLPKRVLIVHQGSQKTFTLPFHFVEASGTALNDFNVPKDAPLGSYSIYLSNKSEMPKKEGRENDPFDWTAQATGNFTVGEYRLPLMQANIKIQGEKLVRPKEVKVDLSAQYLSGGPASGLDVKLRAEIVPSYFSPDLPGGTHFAFFSEPIVTGIVDSDGPKEQEEHKSLKVQELKLKSDGGALALIDHLPSIKRIEKLNIEMEYHDPNGEVKTAVAEKELFPSQYIVGLGSDSWIAKPGKVSAAGVITNTSGKLISDKAYVVEAFKTNFITHRKKLIGGFYSYDSKIETISLGKVCEGKSDSLGRFVCEAKKMPAGEVILQAKVVDEEAHATYANVSLNVFENGAESWWAPTDSDRIDLLPEKAKYQPGETAKIVVRSPFPTSTVLVSIEREGILDSFVREIKRDQSFIEVPIKGNYAPNVFVSVLALRGRAGEVQPTALVDLGKPAMKLGMSELKVNWKAHELEVSLKGDKQKYQTREIANVHIQVKTASGVKLPEGAEVAVAAIDEALLKLKANPSWNLLDAMMGQRSLGVNTSSSQNMVIGKRHFGAKAKAPGGGGGAMAGDSRELFNAMLLWEPHLKLDQNGSADIKIPLNDSITSFHIEAVALAGLQLFGSGHTLLASTKDLIIYSGFAPLVRDGDFVHNSFTLRNTTALPMEVTIKIKSPDIGSLPEPGLVKLAASEAKTLELNVQVPKEKKELEFQFSANDKLSAAHDSLKIKIKAQAAVPPRVMQATLLQIDKSANVSVQQPKDALPNVGGLHIDARDTLLAGLAGVKSYMEDYPYACLEQKISQAISLENKKMTEALIQSLPSYLDSEGLLKFFTNSMCGSAQLTRYISKILKANSYIIPEATKSRMIAGMQSYLNGNYACKTWWDGLVRNIYQDQERILLLDALSELQKFKVSDLASVQITPNLWKTETLVAWFQLLKREASIEGREAYLKQAENILHSRVNYQATLMNLQGDLDWEARWRLFSSRDQEAMGVFGLAIEEASWTEDAGKMARGVVARLNHGIWDTTLANAWGVTSLRKFSAKFEKEKVSGITNIASGKSIASIEWSKTPSGEMKELSWPEASFKSAVNVNLTHIGLGKPWALIQTISAIPLLAPMEFGYKVLRKVTPVVQKVPGKWSVGDVANIELNVTAQADQAWVVVRDPIPAGASHLGNGLEGNSAILDHTPKKTKVEGSIEHWPSEFEEKSQAHFISYAAYLPRGSYLTTYRIRLNSAGEFSLPPTRVEAMYAPETFGEAPNANWSVSP